MVRQYCNNNNNIIHKTRNLFQGVTIAWVLERERESCASRVPVISHRRSASRFRSVHNIIRSTIIRISPSVCLYPPRFLASVLVEAPFPPSFLLLLLSPDQSRYDF
ncbi:hypothetical protein AA313_de0208371 [Arthrobotrys entomopaga]|nr:hypothetical protein AA313_de0208371 [Arthrobotrys entomopaga]